MKRVAFATLGCKVNQVETEALKEEFLERGFTLVPFSAQADVYIINTCTVTHTSDRKSRAIIRRAARRNPGAAVVVTGCMAQASSQEIGAMEGVVLVAGNREKENLVELVEEVLQAGGKEPLIMAGTWENRPRLKPVMYSRLHERTRAFIKIQDGCESFCSYCIVPHVRGPVRSKQPEDVLSEVECLLALGYRELVLSGIHCGFYGLDLPGWNLARLVRLILDQVRGEYRLRLGSIEALELRDELLALFPGEKRLCRHFHLPLQSGSDKILQQMNRRYDRRWFQQLVEKAVAQVPGAAVTSDVMVGFPGEGAREFNQTVRLLEELPLLDLHVFKYSPRPGTPAASMGEQVAEAEKQERSQILLDLASKKKREFIAAQTGKELVLVVERRLSAGHYLGLSDNYIEVSVSSQRDLRGQLVPVILEEADQIPPQGRLKIIQGTR